MADTSTTTYPIPSSNVDVLDLNAKNIDTFSNGSESTYTDRGGVERKTLSGVAEAFDQALSTYGGLTINGEYVPDSGSGGTAYTQNMLLEDPDEAGTWLIVLRNFTSSTLSADIAAGNLQIWQGFGKIETLARVNKTTSDNVAFLFLVSVSGVNYFYETTSETTYYCPLELTGTISSLGTDIDGIRTITVDSVDYLIYSESHYSLLKESINYATSNLAGGNGGLVGIVYKGVTIDALDWLIYPNDGRIYFNSGETGSFSGDFDPNTGIDSGLSGTLSENPAITESRMSSAESVISQNASDISQNASDISAVDTLKKSDSFKAALYLDGSDLKTSQKIQVVNDGVVFNIVEDTAVALPTLSDGVDYKVFCLSDGSLSAQDWDTTDPAGAINIGGFHVYHTTGGINPNSIWDLRWRAGAKTQRGKTLSPDGKLWVDIYLADEEYGVYGYSRPNQTIATGGNPPIVPALYGGNGTDTYGSLTWFEAWDLAINAGCRLPLWGEFTGFSYGVVEQQSVGVDPVTTGYQAGHRSACGVEQATGVMSQWGGDCYGSGAGYSAITDGRGSVYSSSLSAVRLGGIWGDGPNSGSRSASWDSAPNSSRTDLGMRAVCDHQII